MFTFHHVRAQIKLAGIPIVLVVAATAAATNYDEAIHGDLSGDRLNPTQLALSAGTNSLSATSGAFGEEEIEYDREYVRIDLPANHQLDSIRLQAYDSPDGTAFVGLQDGTTFSFEPDDAIMNIGNMRGYAHFGPGEGHNIGDDILPAIAAGAGAMGFTPPLTGSSYTFWLQQTGASTTYQLDFIVTNVPEPASALLMCTAIAAAAALVRRRAVRPC